jgi:hypothetical protein
MLIGAANLSPVIKLVAATGAVSPLFRSQEAVMMQDFICGQMRVSGCNGHYDTVFGPGAKAKTMTISRFTGQVVPRSGKQLTHIVRVSSMFLSVIKLSF